MEHCLVFSEVGVDVLGCSFAHRVAAIAEVPPHVRYWLSSRLDCGCEGHSERRLADFRGGCRLDNGRACLDVDDQIHIEEGVFRVIRRDLKVLLYHSAGLAEFLCIDRDLKLRGFACDDPAALGVYGYSSCQRHFGVDQVHVAVALR